VSIYAGRIREALTSAIDTGKLAEAWQALYPHQMAKALNPILELFLQRARAAIMAALGKVLGWLWAEGYVLGEVAAQAAVTGQEPDWRGWTPGDYLAAEQVAGAGLRTLLDSAGVTIASIADTRIEQLAGVIEQTLASDVTTRPPEGPLPPMLSVGDLARQLEAVLDNPANAELVAQAEIARAQSFASEIVYAEEGIAEVDWSTAEDAKVCPRCDALEAANPHPLGTVTPPDHPRCRCAIIPVLVGAS
jgi:SPP1 gp7 family putative phage head morphogenesis protein